MNDLVLEKNIEYLNQNGIRYSTVLLTENILRHCIFDATRPIRTFLKETSVHDYASQLNGVEHKVYINTHIITFARELLSKSSLYKSSKRGDERMWFGSAILKVARPNSTFAIFEHAGELYVINISEVDLESCCLSSLQNPIKHLLNALMD